MMIHTIGTAAEQRPARTLAVGDWICLAAAPTFAIMAFLTGILGGGPQDMLCAAAAHSGPNGMAWMYLLMSAFHSAPWLKLVSGLRGDSEQPR